MASRSLLSRALASALTLAFMLLAIGAHAAPKPDPKKPAAAPPAEDKDKPYGDWKKLTKDSEVSKGFFNVYRKRENLYLELKPDQLDKPVLGIFSYASGIGSNFVLGGLPINDRVLQFRRAGDRILVMDMNTRFTSPSGTPMEKAKNLSYGNSVIASLKVESQNDSTKAVLVDFANFLVSDVTDLAEGLSFSLAGPTGPRSTRFDKDRSTLTTTKMFPENFEAEALLTYSPNNRLGLGMDGVSDERFIPLTVHYSFSKLPEVPMQPRYADDRVGYFLTATKDFGNDSAENFWLRYVNRWRLEKKDPSAAISEPVKPIVYYIDRTVPAEYRPWVKEAVEKWQKAFEAAGFKDAIIAKDAPDDPNWDAEDVRYSTIRWITSTAPSFGAIGPSRVDPRSGEILDADILVEASMFQNYRNGYRRYTGPEAIANEILPETRMKDWPSWLPLDRRCDAQQGTADGGALLHMALLMDGTLAPGSPVPAEYMHDAAVWVIMHEVGHTLGLRHNFRGSTATPYDKLNDKAWIAEHGMYTSVMEYPTPNISPDRAKQGYYYTQGAGTGDLWAIRYGYAPSGMTTGAADYGFARKIADESLVAGHEYSTDEDTYPTTALDPRTNIYDLGDDPLRFAKDRATYISGLWKAPEKFESRIVGGSGDLTALRRAMDTLLGQYGIALGMAVKYVGGSTSNRVHKDQPEATDPLRPVAAARQREAVEFLGQRAFAADAFAASPAMLNRLAPDRWSHWGMGDMFGARLDYDLTGKALAIQTTLLDGMLAPALLTRLRESESRSKDAYRMSDYFDQMTKMLWGEVGGGVATAGAFRALEGPSTRRDVQRAYVSRLCDLVASPPQGAPDDARALARLQLSRIDARASRVLAGEAPIGDYTRAHLMETRARIKRAMEASRDTDVRRAG